LWRYTTFDDVIRIAKAVSVGSAIMVVSFTLLFRFQAFPRSVFIIDWFILAVFMAGSRIATRWFHELPSREDIARPSVIIAGSGPLAELVLRQIMKSGAVRPIGYLDDRTEMTGRVVHGLKVLGPISDAERIAREWHADEIIVLPSFLNRIPHDGRARLAEAGIRVRAVFDPSELVSPDDDRPLDAPCPGRSVLVAGNGSLIERAGVILSRAQHLTLVSDDARLLSAAAWRCVAPGSRRRCYLGVSGERRSLRAIFDEERPDLVCADFSTCDADPANAAEAYLRTISLPLETIALEASERASVRLIVFEGRTAVVSRDAARATELILLDIFREDPSRCTIMRIEREPSAREWCALIGGAVVRGGGVFQAVPNERVPGTFTFVEHAIERSLVDAKQLRLKLARALDEGGEAEVTSALGEMSRSSPVREHAV
jgi:hypothetical protein